MTPAVAAALRAPLARLLLVGALVLVLQIPACMIGQIARERQSSRDGVVAEIARTWGGSQQLAGPFLAVPYRIRGRDKDGKPIDLESGTVVLLPERLMIEADAEVEARRRGLYEVPVYRARVTLSGRFRAPLAEIGSRVPREALRWDQAQLVLRVIDVHAIDRVAPLSWGGATHDFQGGGGWLETSGLHAPLAGQDGGAPVEFTIGLALRGSEGLHFAPAARDTVVTLRSNWAHPRFDGAWLPERRDVGAAGFSARWQVTSLAAGLPAVTKGGAAVLDTPCFGVGLLYPVDPYRMSERTLKYDLLFLGLTFVAVWLFEVATARRVHPMQYLLVGAALCVFYLLELSLAEHIGFARAYAAAAMAVTAQVSLYARSVLRATLPAVALGALVAALYALLYLLLGAEDYALLIGSGSLFAVLSAVMFLTRRVRWSGASGEPLPA